MASVTLAESAKLSQDSVVQGVIESIVTTNQMFALLPFDGIEGNALAYNRENVLGATQVAGVGTEIVAGKAAATFDQDTAALTTIIGDAEVNGLIQATRSDINDQTGVQIASKAKSAGRQYQNMLINGLGASNEFPGLLAQLAVAQTIEAGANGAELTFALLDELIDKVKAKDGQVDFITMNSRQRRKYRDLLRASPGAGLNETKQLPGGWEVDSYSGVPILVNDWIPHNQTQGNSNAATTILAGTFDDGSRRVGIAGLTAANNSGIIVEDVGIHQSRDERIWRVKWYCGLLVPSDLALAGIVGVL